MQEECPSFNENIIMKRRSKIKKNRKKKNKRKKKNYGEMNKSNNYLRFLIKKYVTCIFFIVKCIIARKI